MTPHPHRHRRGLLLTALVAAVVLAPLRPAAAAAADPGIQPRANVKSLLSHQVYGYLPYWRLDAGTVDRLDYDLISTIALFGLGIKKDGNIDMAWRGTQAYLSDNAAAVTNAAHAKGVRVVPTFQLFDSGTLPDMTAFLHSKAAQSRFTKQALASGGIRSPALRMAWKPLQTPRLNFSWSRNLRSCSPRNAVS